MPANSFVIVYSALVKYIAIFIVFTCARTVLGVVVMKMASKKKLLKGYKIMNTRLLETERLLLRRFELSDAEAVYNNWASDLNVTEYVTWTAHKSIEETLSIIGEWQKDYLGSESFNWAIVEKASNTLIGSIGTKIIESGKAEIGYVLSGGYWGMGIMPEAAARVIKFCFDELGISEISAKHFEENSKSGRVMQKVGMTFEGIIENGQQDNKGVTRNIVCYKIKKQGN